MFCVVFYVVVICSDPFHTSVGRDFQGFRLWLLGISAVAYRAFPENCYSNNAHNNDLPITTQSVTNTLAPWNEGTVFPLFCWIELGIKTFAKGIESFAVALAHLILATVNRLPVSKTGLVEHLITNKGGSSPALGSRELCIPAGFLPSNGRSDAGLACFSQVMVL